LTSPPLEARITFSDNGTGIKPEYAGRVFEMFYRATENTDGSGLGLYIVKQIVDKMNGTIRLESQYGRGTTIRVNLPNEAASTGSVDQPPHRVPDSQ
jgi:signal transduction histidine kinase